MSACSPQYRTRLPLQFILNSRELSSRHSRFHCLLSHSFGRLPAAISVVIGQAAKNVSGTRLTH